MPKVSVVIPTHNYGRFLGEAIQSVLDQTFKDFELIVIDDGSTDNTKEMVDSFKDPRIRYMYQEKCGQSAAYNAGIQASSGEYIALMDSDDILLREALEKCVNILDSHPEAAFSYSQAYHMDINGRVQSLFIPPCKYSCIREGKDEIRELVFSNHISAPAIRRSCLDEVGVFNPAFAVSEDLDLWIRLAKKWSVAYIAEPLIKYRVHANSIMGSVGVYEIERNKSLILEGIFNDKAMGPLFAHLRPKAYSNLYFQLAGDSHRRRQMKVARSYLFQSMRTYPRGFLNIMILLPWMYRFVTGLVPLPILNLGCSAKHYLKVAIRRKSQHLQHKNKRGRNA